MLGICLGAQLLAYTLGGGVRPMDTWEIGWYDLHPTPSAAADPLFCALTQAHPVFQWHGYTFDLPAGAVLGHLPGSEDTPAVALNGRVWVRCDAKDHSIEPGDLLTTSDIPGHAMKATDRERAYGATIGKAMTGLKKSSGLVLVLVNLQ